MNIELNIMEQIESKESDPKLTRGIQKEQQAKRLILFGCPFRTGDRILYSKRIPESSLQVYSGKNTKFTTFFYKGVLMECQHKVFNLNKPTYRIYENIAFKNNQEIEKIDMIDEIETHCDDPDLMMDRFYQNMSVREIAKSRGVSGETIRIKIKKNLAKLRSKMIKVGV